MVQHSTHWDKTYKDNKKVWGDEPSILAAYTANSLKESSRFKRNSDIFILDLGCGYGRDAIFLAQNLPCQILGLDNSEVAINLARESLPKNLEKRIELLCYDFTRVKDKYDVIMVSNLYHLLKQDDRSKLRETLKRCLKKDGMIFMSAFSTRDPEHFGRGTPIVNEANSFQDEKFMHFSTREELEKDFDFLNIHALFERDFKETRSQGNHHHICWILMGSSGSPKL